MSLKSKAEANATQCRVGGLFVVHKQSVGGPQPVPVFNNCVADGCAHWVEKTVISPDPNKNGTFGRCGLILPLGPDESR